MVPSGSVLVLFSTGTHYFTKKVTARPPDALKTQSQTRKSGDRVLHCSEAFSVPRKLQQAPTKMLYSPFPQEKKPLTERQKRMMWKKKR